MARLTNSSFDDSPSSAPYLSRLKDIRERMSHNLTTPQILGVYESYLDNAVEPILVNTRFFDSFLPEVLVWQTTNFRRKVSFLKRVHFPGLVMAFLAQTTPEGRLAAYRNLRLDRGIRIEFIRLFLNATDQYEKACECELPNYSIEQLLALKQSYEATFSDGKPLISTIRESRFWLNAALEFKSMLMEKYVRYCIQIAEKDQKAVFNGTVQLNDIVDLYIMAAARAIDKCDHEQGALTSHIQNWLLTARANVLGKRANAKARYLIELADLDDLVGVESPEPTAEVAIGQDQAAAVIVRIAKILDPVGAGRFVLGLPEILSPSEESTLRKALRHDNTRISIR